jgi:3',5'-cyclic-AMP phosphodiesterase
MDKNKFLWYTDTHFDRVAPWTLLKFVRYLRAQKPKGILLTGDISNGLLTGFHLKSLATLVDCPIYFTLGNHDYHFSSIENQHDKIKQICKDYPNLIWLTHSDVINLQSEVGLIGAEGWYDARLGDPKYLKATIDWMLIKDFKSLSMEERIEKFRSLSQKSVVILKDKLEKALEQDYKTIYLLTHFPPWEEATRDTGTFMEKFWLPYNINLALGQMIEETMTPYKKRRVVVLTGHTHCPDYIRVSRNIDCQVGYPGVSVKNSQIIYV